MTKRSVYLPKATRPFFKRKEISCEFAPETRKSKRAQTVCDAWQALHPEQSILDVSIHSPSESGQKLARENLSLRLATLRKAFCVSTIELASKTFKNGGPYVDLLGTPLKEAKSDPRLKDSGKIVHYSLEGKQYPCEPDYLYFHWLYIMALMDNPGSATLVKNTDAFCDIDFDWEHESNTPAQSCAIFHSLARQNLLKQAKDFNTFKDMMMSFDISHIKDQAQKAEAPITLDAMRTPERVTSFPVGTWIMHPTIGTGEVIKRTPTSYIIRFRVSGPKTLARDFVERNCKKIR